MSQAEITSASSESNQSGLTFVRPLPKGAARGNSSQLPGLDTSGERGEFASLLFPPRFQEDSGQIPAVAGLKLGHFVLEERIGRGGMGAVFRAIDQRLDRVVALKILSPDLSKDADAVQRFQNEARAAAKLDHDNIARVHYIGEENGLHFIAFEFVTGTNVREFIIQKGRLSIESAVNYTLQIAEALRHTSAANVVHRDVKPSNIIVAPCGRAKLVDLGLARHQPADQSQDLTVAGTALGTFDYIAPEQAIDARNVDVRSDIYSLGCTMYHMLTGGPPYPKGTMFQKVMNHHGPIPPSASEKNPNVSAQLSRVVQKMMASNPDERYASADTLIHDLVQIAGNLNLTPSYPEAVVWTTPLFEAKNRSLDSSRTWMAVALVLLLLVYLVDRIQPDGTVAVADSLGESAAVSNVEGGQRDTNGGEAASTTLSTSNVINGQTSGANTGGPLVADVDSDNIQGEPSATPAEVAELATTGLLGGGWISQSNLVLSDKLWNSLNDPHFSGVDETWTGIENSQSVHSETNSTDGATDTPSQPSSPFVVAETKSGEQLEFANLADAVAQAADNSVIEVQIDGVLPVQESAIQFSSKRIILRAAEGLHPVIKFDLTNELALRPLASSAVVFDIGNSGALEIYDVDIELEVDPRTTVDEWAIVQLAAGAEFESRWCSFTIENEERIPAALVFIPSSEAADISNLMPERMTGRPSSVHLRDCFCRGEMDGIKQRELRVLEVTLEETAFAISGTLHRIDGSNSVATDLGVDDDARTRLFMNHVTAFLGAGLLSATTGDHGTLYAIDVELKNSIFHKHDSGKAFVAISGHIDPELLKEKIYWQPQTDLSFIISDGPFFTVESSASFLFEPQAVPLQELPLNLSSVAIDDVFSKENVLSGLASWNEIHSEDLFLNDQSDNPALKSASDGRNAGVNWTRSALLRAPGAGQDAGNEAN